MKIIMMMWEYKVRDVYIEKKRKRKRGLMIITRGVYLEYGGYIVIKYKKSEWAYEKKTPHINNIHCPINSFCFIILLILIIL